MAENVYEAVHLRVEPQAIPQLRAAFEKALATLAKPIGDLGRNGHINGAWMGDPKSEEVVALYNELVMNRPDGQYQALLRYQQELTRVRDQLALLEAEYQRVDGESAATFDGGVV